VYQSGGIFAGGVVFSTLLPEMHLHIAGIEINAFWIGSVSVIVLTGLYTALGGMRAVAYNDAVQVVVLIGGSSLLTFYGLFKLGGWQALRDLKGAAERTVRREQGRVAETGWGARLLALQDADGQMSLAHPDRSGEKQPLAGVEHVLLGKVARGPAGGAQQGINAVRHIGVQGTMAVALGDVSRGDAALLALHLLALAGARNPQPLGVEHPHQPHIIANLALGHSLSSVAQPPAQAPVFCR